MLCKSIMAALCALFSATPNSAQPIIDWQQHYGGTSNESAKSIAPTNDGGYVVLGRTISNDGQVTGHHGLDDLWVIKLNAGGELEWQRCLGGSDMEYAGDIRQTQDGGYILIGSTDSNDGDVSALAGTRDAWVVKLTSAGALEWEHSYGGSGVDEGRWLQVLSNGEFLLFGETASTELEGFHGGRDLWLARIGPSGELLQQRCYGGTAQDMAGYFASLPNDRLLISGAVWSNDGDVTGNHGGTDAWVVSLDENWNIDWQLCLGGSAGDYADAISTASSEEIYVACTSNSVNGDITAAWGADDYWIARLSSDGSLINSASFGGSDVDAPRSIGCGSSNSCYVLGISYSIDGLVNLSQGGADAWLLRLDEELGLIWERAFGGSATDSAKGQCFAPDGGLVLVGGSTSNDGDLTGNFGSSDLWVVKLQPEDVGVHESTGANGLVVFPNPANDNIRIAWPALEVRTMVVYDARGRKMASEAGALRGLRQTQMDISGWSDGLYTVSVLTSGGLLSQRFVKH